MIPIKTAQQISKMKAAGKIAALILQKMVDAVAVGVSTYDLDILAAAVMKDCGAKSACYQYRMGNKIFPAYTCISINSEVVHGIGVKHKILKEGDLVSLDVSIFYEGYAADNACTIIIPPAFPQSENLVNSTKTALLLGIEKARAGNRVGDISFAVHSYIQKQGLSIVRDFVGHGIGKNLHEEPQVPNFIYSSQVIETTPLLQAGMVLAIEPMVNLGGPAVCCAKDGWTIITQDGSLSAHFESTVLITDHEAKILTSIDKA
jgi:methionyl aminopeptidase